MNKHIIEGDPSPNSELADDKYRNLLRDYAAISERRVGAAAAFALRNDAPSYRDIMAFQATGGELTYGELCAKIHARIDLKSYIEDPRMLADLGRVVLLQNYCSEDDAIGETLLAAGIDMLPTGYKSRVYRRLLVQWDILTQNYVRAAHLLELYSDIDRDSHGHLRTDLINPFLSEISSSLAPWLAGFNTPFRKHGLYEVSLEDAPGVPFDRLTAVRPESDMTDQEDPTVLHEATLGTSSQSAFDQDLVSIVLTSFEPAREALLGSVKSLLNQTWENLEIIVVDDSSGSWYRSIFEEVALLDPRVRVVRTSKNSGTYLARNLGYELAEGRYITGQDDDDWSHPQRIETQVTFLQEHPDFAACRVRAIACSENLVMARLGKRTPEETNASTLMLTQDTWKKIGGFLPVRKAADTELYLRLQEITRKKVKDIEVPLTIIRKVQGSLSHSEFRTGWSHPARRHFKRLYSHWHGTATRESLSLKANNTPQVSVPRLFRVNQTEGDLSLDVIFAGDWHPFGGPQRSMLEEIKALLIAGKKVGILHLDPARFMRVRERSLCNQIVELVNSGQVTNVLYDDPVNTELLILRYPPIMQFPPAVPSAIHIKRTLILANQAPEETDGRDIRYIPNMVQSNTERVFNSPVSWVPQSDMVRDQLVGRLDPELIEDFNMPGILNLDEWYVERSSFRSTLPVVGRHSRDNRIKWPEKLSSLTAAYPTDGTFDIRILGGASTPLRVLKQSHVPGSWTVYEADQISPERFLATLDFYVFFQHSKTVEAFGRSILEAIASGLVVVLPHKFEPVFDEAAIYATPENVIPTIKQFHQSWPMYKKQVDRSRAYLEEHFSYSSYNQIIDILLEENHATVN